MAVKNDSGEAGSILYDNPAQHLLFFYRKLNTAGGNVIQKGRVTVALFLTCGAFQPFGGETRDIGLAVLPHEMNNPICLCKSLIRATGTLEIRGILF
jgi:hypothetical protein